jgi:hypothetical protein
MVWGGKKNNIQEEEKFDKDNRVIGNIRKRTLSLVMQRVSLQKSTLAFKGGDET